MAQERIELRIGPGSPSERALIDALDALGGEYGAKGRFLKERLLAGYQVILGELDGLMKEDNPMAALDRYGSQVDAKHYRVLKVFLIGRLGGVERNTVPSSTVAPAQTEAIQVAALPETQPGLERQALSLELAVPAVLSEVGAQPVELPPDVVPVEPITESDSVIGSVPDGPVCVTDTVTVEPNSVTDTVADEPNSVADTVTDEPGSVTAEPEVRKPHNWSAFANIAGAAKKGA